MGSRRGTIFSTQIETPGTGKGHTGSDGKGGRKGEGKERRERDIIPYRDFFLPTSSPGHDKN